MSDCNCLDRVDKKLAEHNGELLRNIVGKSRAFVATIKKDARVRLKSPLVMATYCPFCGVKYDGG